MVPALWLINLRNSPLTAETKTFTFMDWVAYRWGRYGCSSPSTKELIRLERLCKL